MQALSCLGIVRLVLSSFSMELHFHSFLVCAAAIAGLLCNNLLHAKVGECNHQFFCHGVLPWDVCCQRGSCAHDVDTLDCMGAVVVSLENFPISFARSLSGGGWHNMQMTQQPLRSFNWASHKYAHQLEDITSCVMMMMVILMMMMMGMMMLEMVMEMVMMMMMNGDE